MSQQRSTSLPESTATEFLNVLNSLRCPYTQDVDESYLSELLFTPGVHRIRLMFWIFGEVEESIERIINSEKWRQQVSGLGVDHEVQFLTSLGASFGICRDVDFDLIRGKSPFLSQLSFWKKLIGIVEYSKKPYLNAALSDNAEVMEKMLSPDEVFVQAMLQDEVRLLPPNLMKELKMLPDGKKKFATFGNLAEELEKLGVELKEQHERLKELNSTLPYTSEDDEITLGNVICKLDLTLNDIDQMLTAYEQVFTNDFSPYCDKETEEFGNVGPLIEIVSKQLGLVATTFDRLISIQVSNDGILKHGDSIIQANERLSRYSSVFNNFLSHSISSLDKFEKSLNISVERSNGSKLAEQSIFVSKLSESISDISNVL